LNRSSHDSEAEVRGHTRQLAQNMFTDEPEKTGDELDLKKLFIRILEKEDWTDKLASRLSTIRGTIRRPQKDTRLSKELRLLVPDIKEVEKAYVEMTSGYKDFIRDVVKASRLRQMTQKNTSSTKDSSHANSELARSLSRAIQPQRSQITDGLSGQFPPNLAIDE